MSRGGLFGNAHIVVPVVANQSPAQPDTPTFSTTPETKKGQYVCVLPFESGAGEESRTLDLNLGKVALYQLSYSRIAEGEF